MSEPVAKVEIFKDSGKEFRWRAKAGNGAVVSTSGEGYTSHKRAVEQAQRLHPDATLVDLTQSGGEGS